LSSTSGVFNNKNVGTGKTVTVAGIAVTGVDAGNYQLMNTSTQTIANVTARAIQLNAMTAESKVYDGNTSGIITGSLSVTPLLNDDLTLSASGAHTTVFSDKNVGENKTVTVTNPGTLAGADAGNYVLNPVATTTASILKKDVTLASIVAADKVYDGNRDAVISSGVISGVVDGETLLVSGASGAGTFADKNAAAGKTVTVSDVAALMKTDGTGEWRNYNLTLPSPVTTFANISRKSVTITGVTAFDKVHDGSRSVVVNTRTAQLLGLVDSDDVTLSSAGVLIDPVSGLSRPVVLVNTLSGRDVDNYSVTDQFFTTANVYERLSTPVLSAATQTFVRFSPTTVRFLPQPIAVASAAPAVTLPVSATSQPSSLAATESVGTAAGASGTTTTQAVTAAATTSPVASTPRASEPVATSIAEAVAQAVGATPAAAATLPATALSGLPSSVAQSIPAETLQAMSPAQVSSVLAALDPAQAAALTTEQVAQVGDLFAAASDALGASSAAAVRAGTSAPAALAQASPGEVLALLPSIPAEARAAIPAETLESVQALISQALDAEKPTSESRGLGAGYRLAGASLPLSEVPQLTPAALRALTAQDMAAWDAAALQQLTAAQVATLPSETLGGLSAAQLGALNAAQLQGLGALQLAELAALLTPAQLAGLSTAQKAAARDALASIATPKETLPTDSSGVLTGSAAQAAGAAVISSDPTAGTSALPAAPAPNIANLLLGPSALSAEQIAALPLGTWQQLDPLIIQQLSPRVIPNVPLAAMAAWSPEQIAALRGAQLSALSIPQLRVVYLLLAPAQLAQLPEAQVAGLRLSQRFVWVSRVGRNPALLQELLASAKRDPVRLDAQDLAQLGPREAARLSPVSIRQLEAAQISMLQPAVFSALSDQQVRALRSEQIASLDPSQLSSILPWLTSEQVRAITPGQLSGLRNLVGSN
jgi:hypothetical protein